MKCPYRKCTRTYPDGMTKITEEDFLDCLEKLCPYWGAINVQKIRPMEGGYKTLESIGCRKVKNECS